MKNTVWIKKPLGKKQLKSKAAHDKYDEILVSLNRDLTTYSEIESNLVDMAFLKAKGYLEYQRVQDKIDRFIVTLTSTGCVFISEGGFEEEDRLGKERNDELEQTKDGTISLTV